MEEEIKKKKSVVQVKKPKAPLTNFTRFVEIGRVCLINYGPYEGKICVIIDVVDQNRALVSGPENKTGVPRHAINFKRLVLTSIKIKIGRSVRQKTLTKEFVEQKVQEKWENTGLFKKQLSRTKRAGMNDFDRFKCMIAKKKRSKIVKEAELKILHSIKWKGKEPKKKSIKGQGKSAGKKDDKSTGKKSAGKEKPATKHTEKPATKHAEKPATKPDEKPAKKPAEKPAAKPAEKPATKPAEKPEPTPKGGKRPEKPATKPAEKPAGSVEKKSGGGKKGGAKKEDE